MKTTTFTIRGLTPLIMHNGQLADPLNEMARALKKLTDKKKKTDADLLEIRRCEWNGGLYVNNKGAPCLPGEVLEGALQEGARKLTLGKQVKGGIIIEGDWALQYPGPKTVEGLWDSGNYLKLAGVKVKQNRVIRARPIFPSWECTFDVQWDPSIIKSDDQLVDIVETSGITGVGDWRPKFGRFEVIG